MISLFLTSVNLTVKIRIKKRFFHEIDRIRYSFVNRSKKENNFDALILTLPDHGVFAVNGETSSRCFTEASSEI